MQYRIKIEELNNGETRYTPEKAYLEITRGWIQHQRIRWEPLNGASYFTEAKAMDAIQTDKNIELRKLGNKVKSTTYKPID
jgi:hypothetical protein